MEKRSTSFAKHGMKIKLRKKRACLRPTVFRCGLQLETITSSEQSYWAVILSSTVDRNKYFLISMFSSFSFQLFNIIKNGSVATLVTFILVAALFLMRKRKKVKTTSSFNIKNRHIPGPRQYIFGGILNLISLNWKSKFWTSSFLAAYVPLKQPLFEKRMTSFPRIKWVSYFVVKVKTVLLKNFSGFKFGW